MVYNYLVRVDGTYVTGAHGYPVLRPKEKGWFKTGAPYKFQVYELSRYLAEFGEELKEKQVEIITTDPD